jgi:transposase-like protein
MGKKKEKEYQDAYELYCNTNLQKGEICKVVGVSPQQLGKWIKEGDWDLDKSANEVTVPKLIRDYYRNLALINKNAATDKRPLDSAETDQVIKITNAINALRKKYNLSNYHSILKEFAEWLMKANLEHAKILAPDMFEFLQEKQKELRNDS